MELVRLGPSSFSQAEDAVGFAPDPDKPFVHHIFKNFGKGIDRTSDFFVEVTWDDVEASISEFLRNKHPEAIRLKKALALASAVESLVSSGNVEPYAVSNSHHNAKKFVRGG